MTTIYRLSRYDTALMPERLTAPFSGLQPDTTYTVTIYAYNCYGVQSIGEPLAYTFHTPADDGAPVPEVFSAAFDATGATDKISGATLKKDGAVTYDAETQAAKFTREGGYMWNGIASYYDLMKTSVTLEAVVKRTGIPDGETAGILSNYNTEITNGRISGGMSLEYNRAGRVVFRIYLKNLGVRTLVSAAVLPTGRFAHVVATYDGHAMKIYIDGELDATSASDTSSVSYEGEIWFPWKSAEQNLVIGGTGSYGTTYTSARRMNGLVRTANVYARALNESQIRALATPYIAT